MPLLSRRSLLRPLLLASAGALIAAGVSVAQPYHHGYGTYRDYNDHHVHGAWRDRSEVVVNFGARPYYYAPRPRYYHPTIMYAQTYPDYYDPHYEAFQPMMVTPQAYQAFESTPPGMPVVIPSPVGGYTLTPGALTQQSDGRYCREYQAKVSVGGQLQDSYGHACRQPDGSWQIMS